MARIRSISLVIAGLLLVGLPPAHAAPDKTPQKAPDTAPGKPSEKAPEQAPAPPAEPKLTCSLVNPDVPRGGRLEVTGKGFGKAPVVRIAGGAVRMIERTEDTIAVQVPRKSDGGSVTVHADGLEAVCGTLKIIGKN